MRSVGDVPGFDTASPILTVIFSGASLGSALAGVVFDYYQTYRPAFYLTMGLMLASIAGIWVAAPRAACRAVIAPASSPEPDSKATIGSGGTPGLHGSTIM